MTSLRIGNGFDVHPFKTGRDLVLGGKKIEFRFGLDGHSDADVLAHAIIDSLLGAAGIGDIGRMFPDTSEEFKDISSMDLLGRVSDQLSKSGVTVINIDSVIVCNEPKIAEHVEDMKRNISAAMNDFDISRVSIKGKTTEGLGFTGRGEGIAVYSVALVEVA